MRKTIFIFTVFALIQAASFGQLIKIQGSNFAGTALAPKPPMGWNSWDGFGKFPTEKHMLENLNAMVKWLKPLGYTYFVIDAGWDIEKGQNGQMTKMAIDQNGRYISAKTAFPNGIKYIGDKVHAAGLKFGIHIMRGIPRDAYKANLPILDTKYTARDIGDTTSLCTWNSDNYGINMSKSGAQEYYDSYIGQIISWGVDFIKADDITGHPKEVQAVKKAIKKTGKKVMLSISPGDGSETSNVIAYNEADMLRVTKDIWDKQKSIDLTFDAWKKWNAIPERKFWLDMDMIPFGHLCLHRPNPGYLTQDNRLTLANGELGQRGLERMSAFTMDQKYTFITQRALSASPLFIGGDLPTIDKFSLSLISDKNMLACNQNGITGKLIYEKDNIEIWKTPDTKNIGQGWIGIFNRNQTGKKVNITTHDLDTGINEISLFDIWENKQLKAVSTSSPIELNLNSFGVVFCRYKE